MSLELIRELTAALEYEHSFLTGKERHYGESVELLIRARNYISTGGWIKVKDTPPPVGVWLDVAGPMDYPEDIRTDIAYVSEYNGLWIRNKSFWPITHYHLRPEPPKVQS